MSPPGRDCSFTETSITMLPVKAARSKRELSLQSQNCQPGVDYRVNAIPS